MNRFACIFSALLCLGLLTTQVRGQHLNRRSNFGFQPLPLSDSLAEATGLPSTEGVLVGQVMPNSTFSSAGVAPGDIVLELNGMKITGWNDLPVAKQEMWGGKKVEMVVWRKGKRKSLTGTAVAIPRESSDRWQVEYDEVAFDGGYLSMIVTRPFSEGPHPTVYFIPGYTCATVDNLPGLHPYRKLLDSLAGLNYVVVRLEKPGMGDGPNPCNCVETGFEKELAAFRAGWDHLLNYDFVDRERIFMFGHSMGGTEAPLLAADGDVNPLGIAVYGTVYQSWYEYILAMLRFQEPRMGEDFLVFESDMQEYTKMFYEHYVLNRPLAEIIDNPTWKSLLERDFALNESGDILYRRSFFWRELSQRNVVKAWAKIDAHVLSLYGEADLEVFNPESMRGIAQIVNAYHPGKAEFVTFPGTDHSMIEVGSMEEGIALRGTPEYRRYLMERYNYDIVQTLHKWMQRVMAEG